MRTWHEDNIETNGIRLHFIRTGDPGTGRPAIVLAHGITDNGLCWSRVARALEDDYELIMVDARGHGKSDKPSSGYSSQEHAKDHAGLIRSLGLERPILMGHSMGAFTGMVLAAAEPDLLGALILEDPPLRSVGGWDAERRSADRKARRENILARQRHTREELIASEKQNNPGWHLEELNPWADAKLQVSPQVVDYLDESFSAWPQWLSTLTCPTLLIIGDPKQDAIVQPEVANEIKSINSHIEVAQVNGAGHSIHRDRFDTTMQIVRRFLERSGTG